MLTNSAHLSSMNPLGIGFGRESISNRLGVAAVKTNAVNLDKNT